MFKKSGGLTMLEIVITIALVGVLATIAVSTYMTQVRKGRRIDAIETMLAISLAEERYRSQNTTYGSLAQVWNGVSTTSEGFYTVAVSNISGSSYTITATAVGDQANDTTGGTSCATLTLSFANGTMSNTPAGCWPD